MQIIPAIDLLEGQAVRLFQGDYKQKTVYSSNPVTLASEFKQAGFSRLHIVDLSGAKAGEPVQAALVGEMKKTTGLSIETGGGIRKLSQVQFIFDNYLNKNEDFIMLGTLPLKDRREFDSICASFARNILLTIDVWDREIMVSGWQENTRVNIFEFLSEMVRSGINNFLVTQIQKDGTLNGPDHDLYADILARYPEICLTASGGIGSIHDFQRLQLIPRLFGAILGKAFYEKKISLAELKTLQI